MNEALNKDMNRLVIDLCRPSYNRDGWTDGQMYGTTYKGNHAVNHYINIYLKDDKKVTDRNILHQIMSYYDMFSEREFVPAPIDDF